MDIINTASSSTTNQATPRNHHLHSLRTVHRQARIPPAILGIKADMDKRHSITSSTSTVNKLTIPTDNMLIHSLRQAMRKQGRRHLWLVILISSMAAVAVLAHMAAMISIRLVTVAGKAGGD
jgi:hypothetical protein